MPIAFKTKNDQLFNVYLQNHMKKAHKTRPKRVHIDKVRQSFLTPRKKSVTESVTDIRRTLRYSLRISPITVIENQRL